MANYNINVASGDGGRRDLLAERAGHIISNSLSENSSAYGTSYTQIDGDSAVSHRVELPEDRKVCCGVMFPVRRTFCLLVTFDLILTFIVWVSYVRILAGKHFISAFNEEVLHYTFQSSLFDTVMCAACRFVLLLMAYALFRIQHPWVVAVCTFSTCLYLLAKIFLFNSEHGDNNIISYAILLLSFVIAWIEAWFLDFKMLPWEQKQRDKCLSSISERSSLLHQSINHGHIPPRPQYYPPIESSSDSDDADSLQRVFMSVATSRRISDADESDAEAVEKAGYKLLANEVWRRGWEILQMSDGWKFEGGVDPIEGVVYSQHVPKQGKVFRLEGVLDATPQVVFDDLILHANETPSWNPTVLECKTLQYIDDHTDIAYNVAAQAVGGLVSSRDFVSIRHWKTQDGVIFTAACAVKHADMPVVKQHVRAEHRPGGLAFSVAQQDPNKCQFCWILNTDIKGWVPQYAVDQALSGTLLEFLKHLKTRVAHITQQQQQQPMSDDNPNV